MQQISRLQINKVIGHRGACGYAPMMQLGKTYREHLTKEKVDQIIDECRQMAARKITLS